MATRDRILDEALASFGTRGYGATSLDDLAVALGLRKQTILYHLGSKEALLDAVIDRSAAELSAALEAALAGAGPGWDRVEAVVRSVFTLAGRRPALLGLLREVSRLGPPASTRLTDGLEPLVERARSFLEAEMAAGRVRRHDPRLLLLSSYSAVIGVATEVEVLRAVGIEPTARSLVRRRAELLTFLRSALLVDGAAPAPAAAASSARSVVAGRDGWPASGAPAAHPVGPPAMAVEGEGDEAVDQLAVGNP